jgi:predicted unusual protein kinase regulating ubiquinone biosynthesis (AarF/ABC1/UbiB family)
MKSSIKQPENLYDQDFQEWIQKTIEHLQKSEFEQLDREHLIEELEDLGKRDRNKAVSLLEQIIRHLLLLQYWSAEHDNNASHWEAEIDGFRTQLRRHLTTTLRQYLEQELSIIYQDALRYSNKKTRLQNLPKYCPYTLENLLDSSWLP